MPCNAINLQVDFHVDLHTDSQYLNRKKCCENIQDEINLYTVSPWDTQIHFTQALKNPRKLNFGVIIADFFRFRLLDSSYAIFDLRELPRTKNLHKK